MTNEHVQSEKNAPARFASPCHGGAATTAIVALSNSRSGSRLAPSLTT